MEITKKQRQEVEELVIQFFDTLDKSKVNSEYYKNLFSTMTDAQFVKFISKDYPFKFQLRQSVTEPTMDDIIKACDLTGVPLLEEIYLPYYYKNSKGEPVKTAKCMVGYNHIKKVQQVVTKKSKWSTEVENRDMKSGRLLGQDKGTAISNREFESLVALGLENTMYEFARPKADAMKAKNAMNAAISAKGYVTQADIPNDEDDMLSRNMINAYLLSAHISTNLLNTDNYTTYTLKEKRKAIERDY